MPAWSWHCMGLTSCTTEISFTSSMGGFSWRSNSGSCTLIVMVWWAAWDQGENRHHKLLSKSQNVKIWQIWIHVHVYRPYDASDLENKTYDPIQWDRGDVLKQKVFIVWQRFCEPSPDLGFPSVLCVCVCVRPSVCESVYLVQNWTFRATGVYCVTQTVQRDLLVTPPDLPNIPKTSPGTNGVPQNLHRPGSARHCWLQVCSFFS